MSDSGARVEVDVVQSKSRAAGASILLRPHVCFVSMNIYPILTRSTEIEFAGGGELQQAILARMLREDGYRVSVLTADHGQTDPTYVDGISIHRVPACGRRGLKGLRFLHPMSTDIVAALKRIDPDIVYFRVAGFRAAAAAWYAARHGKRFVYASASDREFQARSVSRLPRRDDWMFRYAVGRADGILAQNVFQQEMLRARFGRESTLVPNCYAEPDAQQGKIDGPILWVGTFKPVKRPELFMELARRMPTRQFVMVGGADLSNDPGNVYFERMRSLAAQVPNLQFVGYVPVASIGGVFDGASVLVNTSDSEGFPNTFLQAWIRGIPTLSFVSPQVLPGDGGTIDCRDLEQMISCLEKIKDVPDEWQAQSERCLAHFARVHGTDVVLKQYRMLFQKLMLPNSNDASADCLRPGQRSEYRR